MNIYKTYTKQLYLRSHSTLAIISFLAPTIAFYSLIGFGLLMKEYNSEKIETYIYVGSSITYISLLLLFSSEVSSGLLTKFLNNSIDRAKIFKYAIFNSTIYGILLYLILGLAIKLFGFYDPQSIIYSAYFFKINMFLSFLSISYITLFLALLFKQSLKTVLIGALVIRPLEGMPALFLSASIDKHYGLLSPHYLYQALSQNLIFLDRWMVSASLSFFIILALILVYFRTHRMNF